MVRFILLPIRIQPFSPLSLPSASRYVSIYRSTGTLFMLLVLHKDKFTKKLIKFKLQPFICKGPLPNCTQDFFP